MSRRHSSSALDQKLPPVQRCARCEGRGWIEGNAGPRTCPGCDGEPYYRMHGTTRKAASWKEYSR